MNARQMGDEFERLACALLTKHGLQIVQTNYHVAKIGEIDVVACQNTPQHQAVLVFVEVKARRTSRFASAAQSVTKAKQRRIVRAAEHFLQTHGQFADWACRFDVVAFDINQEQPDVQWIQGAFLVDECTTFNQS